MFQVDFDPKVISYAKLLDVVWSNHNPCANAWSKQYQALILFHDKEQQKVALDSRQRLEKRLGKKVRTEVRALKRFYLAEDYHQKYGLRRNAKLTADLRALYATQKEFVDSTAAAKVNAYLSGHLEYPALQKALATLGLRAIGDKKLTGIERTPTPARSSASKPQPARG